MASLTLVQESSGDTSPIPWNFNKFLLRPDGTVEGRYAHDVDIVSLGDVIESLIKLSPRDEEL